MTKTIFFKFAFRHARFSHTSFKTSMCTVSDSSKQVFEVDLLKRAGTIPEGASGTDPPPTL